MSADEWSAAGSMLSGVGTIVAVCLAGWAARTAVANALLQSRRAKADEKRADVAQQAWMAAFRLFRGLDTVTSPWNIIDKDEATQQLSASEKLYKRKEDALKRVNDARNSLLDAWALAELHLPKTALEQLDATWSVTGKTIVDFDMYAMSLDSPGDMPDARKNLFGDASKERRASCETKLRDALIPIARHE
ncbi:hypothetical protein HJC10_03260 [Corallococcus exiguus]|nr:hypothetical protein [Corallococcus exiguus]